MDFDSWDYEDTPSTSSMNRKFIRSDRGKPGFRMEMDDYDDEEEAIYPCPYCSEDYGDAESMEYHIGEAHPAKTDFNSELLKLKKINSFGKEFQYGSSRTNIRESILGSASSNGVVDDLLAFVCEVPIPKNTHNEQQLSTSSDLCIDEEELSGHKKSERAVASSPMSEERVAEDKEVRSRCHFAQDLMYSALFDNFDL